MSLSVADRLGPYEIVGPLGAGGMGEVYRATDTRLHRDVAVKVSAERFTERFEREARVIASLNHPNICTLFDVGPNYLVMELIEGPTLAERIALGAIPLEESLQIAKQIADALEAAHEKGIVHRDLKPGNIKITPDGTVKVLDFGLAKVGGTPTAKAEDSPTISMAATQAGMILGTAAYMSPEQARGKVVDKRADIWAFGVVLYEMLTGKRLFHGDDVTDTLAAVLRQEPDWEQVPVKVRRLLRKCLQKDPKRRLRDIGDAWELLEDAPRLSAPSRSRFSWAGWAAAAALGVMVIVLGVAYWRSAHPPDPPLKPLVRLDVDLGSDVSLGSVAGADAILSPDGNRLVYVSQGKLLTRRMDQQTATELSGTEGGYAPFFSPDGQWVGFFTSGKLKKVSVEGGSAIPLCDAPLGVGGSWGDDGNIIAKLTFLRGGLSRIPSAGGTPASVTELSQGEITHRWPQILPGGKAVLFTSHNSLVSGFDVANIEVLSIADGRTKTLQRGGTFGRYLPSGHLVYVSRGTLFAVPFDLDTLAVRGTPTPVLEQVGYSPSYGSAQLDFSRTGTLVYRSSDRGSGGLVTMQWLDGGGKTQALLMKPGSYGRPRLSPDGQRLALEVSDGSNFDTWVYDWRRDNMTRLTFGAGKVAMNPVWSPDGRFIVFSGQGGMFWTRSDGAGKPQSLTQSNDQQVPFSFTPDGKHLTWNEQTGSGYDLWTMSLENDSAVGLRAGKPEVFLQTPFDERQPVFSPDGQWIAYASDESGTFQVYVRAFPDKGGKWQASSNGGSYPVWSRGGRELFFRAPDNRIMVAAYVAKGDSFAVDKPRIWSEKRLADFGIVGTASYDVAPDGKRIAALMPVEGPGDQKAQNHVIFLENFFDELRRRVPVGK